MRRFESEDFNPDLAEAILSIHLEIPDSNANEALEYVRQFVQRAEGGFILHRGYIPEEYLDGLVRIRDVTSNRQFSRAVEALGVDGGVSESVTFEGVGITVQNSRTVISELDDLYYEAPHNETKKNIRTIQSLLRQGSNREDLTLYLPANSATFLAGNASGVKISDTID